MCEIERGGLGVNKIDIIKDIEQKLCEIEKEMWKIRDKIFEVRYEIIKILIKEEEENEL